MILIWKIQKKNLLPRAKRIRRGGHTVTLNRSIEWPREEPFWHLMDYVTERGRKSSRRPRGSKKKRYDPSHRVAASVCPRKIFARKVESSNTSRPVIFRVATRRAYLCAVLDRSSSARLDACENFTLALACAHTRITYVHTRTYRVSLGDLRHHEISLHSHRLLLSSDISISLFKKPTIKCLLRFPSRFYNR